MRQLAAAALAFAYAGGALAFAPAPSALPTSRASLRAAGASLAPQARPTAALSRKGRAALRMAETMEGRHLPQIIQGGMGVQVRAGKQTQPSPGCARCRECARAMRLRVCARLRAACVRGKCAPAQPRSSTAGADVPRCQRVSLRPSWDGPLNTRCGLCVCQVSSWKLAREVARSGELGIISGTAMDVVLLRWMQDGDPDGLYRRALAAFPDQDMVKRFMDKYYIEGGKPADKPYRGLQMWTLGASQELREACVLGNFAEVGTENARSFSHI